MTRLGVISPMDTAQACEVLGRIGTERSRVHPIGVLSALLTYRSGRGVQGQHSWEPASQVVDALDSAFERSFAQAPQTGSRLYLGIDVSGSMGHGEVAGVPNLTPRMAAAAGAQPPPGSLFQQERHKHQELAATALNWSDFSPTEPGQRA